MVATGAMRQHCPDEFHIQGHVSVSERCFFAAANIADIRFIHQSDNLELIFLNNGDEGGRGKRSRDRFPLLRGHRRDNSADGRTDIDISKVNAGPSSTPLSADCTDASAASSDASASWNCCFEITPASKS